MSYAQQADALAGPIGLLKTFCTRCAGDIVDDAVQIFGGRAITQGGSEFSVPFLLSLPLAQ